MNIDDQLYDRNYLFNVVAVHYVLKPSKVSSDESPLLKSIIVLLNEKPYKLKMNYLRVQYLFNSYAFF
jgi:hypothetical protein